MEKIKVLCGADRLDAADSLLRGRRIALLTAASGVSKQGIPTYQLLRDRYRLDVLFAPEHGIYTNLQDGGFNVDTDFTDPETGAAVCNLTSKGHPRLREMLGKVDIAVYDIQDVGARFYTYLCNLTQLMRGCREAGIPLLILDRPNPIGGEIQGEILDESRFSSFIGEFAIPTRYGMTVGEYAGYVNAEKGIGCELHVLPCEGWSRDVYYDQTDLLFVNPSPNITSVDCMLNYIGGCIWEATNISEGRGTTRPFDLVGAPFVDSKKLYDELNSLPHDGVVYRRVCFTPQFNKHAGAVCNGLELHITDRDAYRPIRTMLYLFDHMRRYPEFEAKPAGLSLRFGTDMLSGGYDAEKFLCSNQADIADFARKIKPYLIY